MRTLFVFLLSVGYVFAQETQYPPMRVLSTPLAQAWGRISRPKPIVPIPMPSPTPSPSPTPTEEPIIEEP